MHTLEAALWSVWQTDNFHDAVLLAVNLGDDADSGGQSNRPRNALALASSERRADPVRPPVLW
jgi:hypothetical protein